MNNAPAKKFRIGYITATIWKNDGLDKPFYSVDITRSYKDSNGDYQTGTSFNHADLANVAILAARAESWISEQ